MNNEEQPKPPVSLYSFEFLSPNFTLPLNPLKEGLNSDSFTNSQIDHSYSILSWSIISSDVSLYFLPFLGADVQSVTHLPKITLPFSPEDNFTYKWILTQSSCMRNILGVSGNNLFLLRLKFRRLL